MRKRFSLHSLTALVLMASIIGMAAMTAQADTIRLKNGSVIKGKVASFVDEQFVVLLDSGSGRSMSKAMIYIADVAKIDFDGAPESSSLSSTPSGAPAGGSTRDTNSTSSTTGATGAEDGNPSSVTPGVTTKPVRDNARDNGRDGGTPPVDPSLTKKNTPKRGSNKELKPPDPVTEDPATNKEAEKTNTATEEPAASEPVRKPLANARVINVDIAAKRDWTSSGVIVKRGDRVRITATGTITLDGGGQTSGPEGIDLADTRKLMGEKPTGGLIGVIGADNDDFLFIGRTTEFTATRDGLLFLSVNEGTLTDNSGTFKAVIEVQAGRPGARQ